MPLRVKVTMSGSAPTRTVPCGAREAASKNDTVPGSVLAVACSATATTPWLTATELAPGVGRLPTRVRRAGSRASSTSTRPAWALTTNMRAVLASNATISDAPSSHAPVA